MAMEVTKKQNSSDSSHERKVVRLFSKMKLFRFTNYFTIDY